MLSRKTEIYEFFYALPFYFDKLILRNSSKFYKWLPAEASAEVYTPRYSLSCNNGRVVAGGQTDSGGFTFKELFASRRGD